MIYYDPKFLKQLDEWSNKEVYARIISLSWEEKVREEISGYITGGSITVDGSSCLRRTCNLTLIAEKPQINEFYWALESKFKVEIGIRNEIDSNYEDIIWFPQGIFIITSFSQALNGQGYTIQIQGKDKMCLLDGSIGGNIPADHDFGKIQIIDKNTDVTKYEDILIYDIIREAIHTYGREDYSRIIINDLEDCSVMLLTYKAKNTDLYLYKYSPDGTAVATNMGFPMYDAVAKAFEEKRKNETLVPNVSFVTVPTKINEQTVNIDYTLIKHVIYNETPGYQLTDLTYVGDLIMGAGSSITSMLDKIAQMLGEFEYFYNLEGHFVFQRKKIYMNMTWTNEMRTADGEYYYDSLANSSAHIYEFTSGQLIESFNNKPQINLIKNDFTVWGERVSNTGVMIPVHMRYAIEEKPTEYFSLSEGRYYYALPEGEYAVKYILEGDKDWKIIQTACKNAVNGKTRYEALVALMGNETRADELLIKLNIYGQGVLNLLDQKKVDALANDNTSAVSFEEASALRVDWRELIHQMAKDNLIYSAYERDIDKYNNYLDSQKEGYSRDNELLALAMIAIDNSMTYGDCLCTRYSNNEVPQNYQMTYNGVSVQLPAHVGTLTELALYRKSVINHYEWLKIAENKKTYYNKWITQTNILNRYDAYYPDMLEYWTRLYNPEAKEYELEDGTFVTKAGWNPTLFEVVETKQIINNQEVEVELFHILYPEILPFWMEFQDLSSYLNKYAVELIGRRTKVVKDSNIKAIFFRETPNILFTNPNDAESQRNTRLSYDKLNLTAGMANYFVMSSQGKSAEEAMDELIYNHTYFQESVTINCVPIYYLEPNCRIKVYDEQTGINGEYIIKSFTLQFAHDGMMSITATKAEETIL